MELLADNTGNWDIYRITSLGEKMAYIFRKNRKAGDWAESQINRYINTHCQILSLGLPTLKEVKAFSTDIGIGICTEG